MSNGRIRNIATDHLKEYPVHVQRLLALRYDIAKKCLCTIFDIVLIAIIDANRQRTIKFYDKYFGGSIPQLLIEHHILC